jgi:NitT/TauT family transport system substrate-binding protein
VSVGANTFADPEHPAFAVLVTPSINRWKDLEGQYIAVNATTSHSAIAMRQRLHQEDVHATTPVITPMANMGLSVAGGNVAAAVMTEPWLTQSLLRGDGKLFGWIIGGVPFERVEHSMILFRTDVYRNKPQAVKAFLRAHLQAVRWIDQHPEQARSILAKWLGLSQEVAQKVLLLRWALEARNDPALLESVQASLIEMGLLKAQIPTKQLYDETLLDEVLAEKR